MRETRLDFFYSVSSVDTRPISSYLWQFSPRVGEGLGRVPTREIEPHMAFQAMAISRAAIFEIRDSPQVCKVTLVVSSSPTGELVPQIRHLELTLDMLTGSVFQRHEDAYFLDIHFFSWLWPRVQPPPFSPINCPDDLHQVAHPLLHPSVPCLILFLALTDSISGISSMYVLPA